MPPNVRGYSTKDSVTNGRQLEPALSPVRDYDWKAATVRHATTLRPQLALLRPEPANDTVNALYELASVEAFERWE